MLKIKASKKDMKENYKILGTGYCSMQYLLRFKEPVAYSTRAEGWACDYYEVDDVVISTGYAPLKNKNMDIDYSTIKAYENKARDIVNSSKSWEDKEKEVNSLLSHLLSDPFKKLSIDIINLLTDKDIKNVYRIKDSIIKTLKDKSINRESSILKDYNYCELVSDDKIIKIYNLDYDFIKIRLDTFELI